MSVDDWARLIIAVAVFDWGVAILLAILARHYRWPALVERALVSLAIAGGVTGAAVLGWNVLSGLGLPADVRFALLMVAVILPSLANVSWLVALFLGRFRQDEP